MCTACRSLTLSSRPNEYYNSSADTCVDLPKWPKSYAAYLYSCYHPECLRKSYFLLMFMFSCLLFQMLIKKTHNCVYGVIKATGGCKALKV